MKNVEFKGKKTNLSRFGHIKKGDVLAMMETEFDDIKDDPRFRLIDDDTKRSEEEIEIAHRVKPWGTGNFDLRTVPWNDPKLPKILISRTSKVKLLNIARAIEEVGGVIEHCAIGDDRLLLVDKIIVAYRAMGWDQITAEDRYKLPKFSDLESVRAEVPTVEEAKQIEEQKEAESIQPAIHTRVRTRERATA